MPQLLALLRRYSATFWCHRWKALGLAWLVCLAGWAAVYALPDKYKASTRVYADADAILGSLLKGVAVDASPTGRVETLQRTLLSRPNLERVVARTDLDLRVDSATARERLLQQLGKQIRLIPQGGRNLFSIEYIDHDPRVAYDVVRTVLNIFLEAATSGDRQQMDNARAFVAQQLGLYETQLRDIERRRAEFQARYIDLLPSDALGGASRLEAGRSRLQGLRGELQDARMRRELTRKQLDSVPAFLSAAEAGGGGGGSRLADAERLLRELQLRYTEQHPDVIATRALIEELRAHGGGRSPAAPRGGGRVQNPLHEQLRVRLVDAEAAVASLERQVREQEAEVERLEGVARSIPDVLAQFTNLNRDYTVIRRQYDELLERREAVQVADAARTGADRVRLEVVDPPTLPLEPAAPNRPLFYTAVLGLGLGAGLGLVLLLAQLDTAFHTPRDLRSLGLPVLGAISAPLPRRRVVATTAYALGLALLLASFGAVLTGLPQMTLRMIA